MPDITMCFGKDCPVREFCYRYKAEPTPRRQSYSDFKFDKTCDHFIEHDGKFKKGFTPHNAGKKLEDYLTPDQIKRMKKTSFKKGQRAGEKNNTWKGGVQEMTHDCVYLYDGVGKRKRRPKAVYEEHFGKVPKGYVIYHKDGNKNNDDPDNLEAISRAELMRRNSGK